MSANEPKKRLKAAQSRRALLDSGVELLRSRGVAPGLDRVTLKDAIEHSGVPRSTAYRLYEGGRGQLEEFRADLLSDLDNSIAAEPVATFIDQAITDVQHTTAAADPVHLANVLRQVIRTSVQASMDSLVESLEWRVYMSSLASLEPAPETHPQVAAMLRETAHGFGERFVEFFQGVAKTFGVRVKDNMSTEDFALAVGAICEGVALRQAIDPKLATINRPTGANGELQSWNAAAVAVEALVLTWAQPDLNATATADLSSWINFG